MFVVKYKNFFIGGSLFLALASLFLLLFFKLQVGIDFTGGSLIEVAYTKERPEFAQVDEGLAKLSLGAYRLQPTGTDSYVLRTKALSEVERLPVLDALSLKGTSEMTEKRFNSVGSVIGDELRRKSFTGIFVVIFAIVVFIAFSFRKVSRPVSSWKYGVVAIITLAHDVLIPVGVFALLGKTSGVEVDILFVTALLAILGFSIHDTIVVFDRIRENLRINEEHRKKESFDVTVGKSLHQTYARSLNTSLTVLIPLLVLYFIGGDSTKYFCLALFVGVIAGAYSSIILASPLLVYIQERSKSSS